MRPAPREVRAAVVRVQRAERALAQARARLVDALADVRHMRRVRFLARQALGLLVAEARRAA